MPDSFYCQFIPPAPLLADFVESIGMLHNPTDEVKEVVVVPDGRVDLFFLRTGSGKFQVMLIGLETAPEQRMVPPNTLAYVISFKPLAVEYILQTSIAELLNTAKDLPDDFWGFNAAAKESPENGKRMHAKDALKDMLDFFGSH
ncbi:DUF6597 domain-containing transcriptional factor [Ferruginibacter sp. HRS2-29]|uniref:DUF6597 domain-containing transcriptional factor n=1 Tax=Ferruginibacter sp. HRS2-29 TaxID=2487334 RepID=UPI0020CEF0DE|nr:DUF6597 domain-containing transcriptional factor [Ferruginibacter sp. HRS2-29]MCP9750310.1 hypothetical protein [Ferruginibacter sp. HRS2-29]